MRRGWWNGLVADSATRAHRSPWRMWTHLALVAMVLGSWSQAWAAPAPPNCSNPQEAADTLFRWLQPDAYAPAKASTCLALPEGAQGERLAVQLKQVLDARGVWVPVASMPTDPNYMDEDGEHRVVPMPDEFPLFVVVRGEDAQWRIASPTLTAVPQLYASTFSPLSVWFQRSLPSVMYTRVLGLHLWQLLYGVLLLGIALLGAFLTRILLRTQVKSLLERSKLTLDDDAYARTNTPVVLLVVFGVLLWGLTDLQLGIGAAYAVRRVLTVAMWVVGLFTLSRFVNVGGAAAKHWANDTDSKLDDQAIPLLRQAIQMVLLVIGGLYIADAVGIDVWQLAAGVGIGGLAFALAAQDTVANVFGSINIFVDRPFQIGDWVKIGPVEGVVEEVGFRSTRVRTFYNSLVTIPNSQITNANVDNLGLRPRRRIKLTLGLTYNTPTDKVQAYVEGIRAILASHPAVQRSYEVHFYNLGGSALEILVYYHVLTPDWHEELVARSQNLMEFMRLAERLNVSFAFPSTSVYVESTPDRPLAPQDPMSLPELQEVFDSFAPAGTHARPGGPPFDHSWSVKGRDGQRGNADGA